MIRLRITRFRVACLLAGAMLFLALGALVGPPSFSNASYSRVVLSALKDARSVTFTEFATTKEKSDGDRYRDREVVIQTVTASPVQIADFRRITSRYLEASLSKTSVKCFWPHHRIEIVRSDGTPFHLELCFQCRNMRIEKRATSNIPSPWIRGLKEFFTALDMSPKNEDEYQKLAGDSDN